MSFNILKLKLKKAILNFLGYNIKLRIGRNVRIDNFVKIKLCKNSKLFIGDNVYIGRLCFIGVYNNAELYLGKGVHLSQGVIISCHESIKIRRNSIIGYYSFLGDGDHSKPVFKFSKINSKPIEIEENVWLATRVTVLKGTKIGKNSIIGAGTVIANRIIPENSTCINQLNLKVKGG